MIVPEFWAEGRVQERLQGRQVTMRRFGWSDTSQDEAQRHADERAREALALLAAGQPVVRRELKLAYNGAEGVPIREEILSRHDAAVVTRNLYGARCLNTPDVLFADIDFSVVLGPRQMPPAEYEAGGHLRLPREINPFVRCFGVVRMSVGAG